MINDEPLIKVVYDDNGLQVKNFAAPDPSNTSDTADVFGAEISMIDYLQKRKKRHSTVIKVGIDGANTGKHFCTK